MCEHCVNILLCSSRTPEVVLDRIWNVMGRFRATGGGGGHTDGAPFRKSDKEKSSSRKISQVGSIENL